MKITTRRGRNFSLTRNFDFFSSTSSSFYSSKKRHVAPLLLICLLFAGMFETGCSVVVYSCLWSIVYYTLVWNPNNDSVLSHAECLRWLSKNPRRNFFHKYLAIFRRASNWKFGYFRDFWEKISGGTDCYYSFNFQLLVYVFIFKFQSSNKKTNKCKRQWQKRKGKLHLFSFCLLRCYLKS